MTHQNGFGLNVLVCC